MPGVVDTLEKRVAAAVDLIGSLRETVAALERELAAARPAADLPAAPSGDPALIREVERLRSERVVVRERIRVLLREIDRVPW